MDLFSESELASYLKNQRPHRAYLAELPFLIAPVGPDCPWNAAITWTQTIPVPCQAVAPDRSIVAVRLAYDPEMAYSAAGQNLAALALSDCLPALDSSRLFVVDRGADTVVRRIRRGVNHLYLVSDRHLNSPECWQKFPIAEHPFSRGELVWLGISPLPEKASLARYGKNNERK